LAKGKKEEDRLPVPKEHLLLASEEKSSIKSHGKAIEKKKRKPNKLKLCYFIICKPTTTKHRNQGC